MPKIHGSYQDRPYTIHLGENLLHDQALVSSNIGSQAAIISHACLRPYCETIKEQLTHCQCNIIMLPEGEQTKKHGND